MRISVKGIHASSLHCKSPQLLKSRFFSSLGCSNVKYESQCQRLLLLQLLLSFDSQSDSLKRVHKENNSSRCSLHFPMRGLNPQFERNLLSFHTPPLGEVDRIHQIDNLDHLGRDDHNSNR